MLEHDGIDISEGIDTNKISGLPKSIIVITSVSQHKFQIAVKKKNAMGPFHGHDTPASVLQRHHECTSYFKLTP